MVDNLENRVCEDFNSELKNKLNKHATEQSEKLSDLKELERALVESLQTSPVHP